eukprot:490467_1
MEAIEETKQDSKDEEEAFRILIWIICDSSRDKKLSDDVDSHTVSMFMCVRYNANLRIRSIKMKIQKAGVTTAKPYWELLHYPLIKTSAYNSRYTKKSYLFHY